MKNINSTYFRSLSSHTFRGLVAGMTVCFLTVTSLASAESGPDLSARISHASVLYQNLVPVGGTPAEVESSVLWSIVEQMRHGRVEQSMPALEQFIADYPNSPWVPSLRANLGRYYYEHGLYTRALRHWQCAWSATRTAESGPAKNVADFTFAYWTRLLGSLGRMDTLRTLYQETEGRIFDNGPLQQVVNGTKEGYRMMHSDPGICFKCGTFALNSVARTLNGPSFDTRQILSVPSPKSGFSMTKLVELAKESGLDLVPAEWSAEKELIVPSVVHWKENHYAAILEQKNGAYLVMDPTFGRPRWLSADAIQEEASGFFLVPKDKMNADWKILASVETDRIYGRGYVYDANDPNDGCGNGSGGGGPGGGGGSGGPGGGAGAPDATLNASGGCSTCGGGAGGSGGGGGCPTCGNPGAPGNQGGNANGPKTSAATTVAGGVAMPVWRISEPYISAWLYDRPLGTYEPGLGYPVDFMLAYKQRDSRTPSPSFFSFGKMWESSWLSYVTDYSPGSIANMAVPGGGERSYTPDGATQEYFSNTTMQRTTDGPGNLTGFVVAYASGAADYYQFVPSNHLDAIQVAFLTEKVDPAGHTSRFIYQETNDIVFLDLVIDADGRTNTLFYTDTTFPSYVTGVQDPFGRTATIKYDSSPGSINYGMITSIVDVAALASSFSYDSQGWATNLITPYGTNLFQYATNTDNYNNEFYDNQPYTFIRAVRVIDPALGTNIYMLRQDSRRIYTNVFDYYTNSANYLDFLPLSYDSSVVPSGVPTPTLDNTYLNYRDSFLWGPRQAMGLPLDFNTFTPSNFKKARMSHWLHDRIHINLGQTLDMRQDPSPDGIHDGQTTWFGYDGKPDAWVEGSCSLPSLIARVLPDGTTWYEWFRRDEWARSTNVVETYSTGFGDTPLTRTNIYVYNGGDLVQHVGPQGETLDGYHYDAKHEPLRATNAVGDVWYYSYDSKGRLTNTLSPSSLNIDYIYFPSGDYANWVATNIDREISRTNSFTYATNLIYSHTDERGLTTTNLYDPLNRITSTADSRGKITYTYDKLDLIQVIDRMGFTNRYVYDPDRRMTAHTNALGRFTLYNYCTCGALDSIRDAAGNYTYYFYDNAGRLLNTVFADGYAITNNFNLISQITNAIDSASYSVTNWFNNQGLRYVVATAAGNQEFLDFDDEDRATNIVNSEGVSITNTFDNLGRLLTRGYPDGGVERFGYSTNGLIAYINQIGMTNFFAYDAAGRKTFETNANNELIRYTNNVAGDLLSLTDGKNQTTRWKYDQYGRVTNKLDQGGVEILRYQYDPDNRLTNRWSAAKGNTKYSYDPVGNVTNINYPISPDVAFGYDALNRMTNMVDAIGTTKYTYSAAGQLLSEDGPFASDTVTNGYSNRLRTSLSLQQPTGFWTNGFAYDATKRLTNVTSPAGAFGYLYDPNLFTHHPDRATLPNTSYITNGYDANARLTATYLNKNDNSVFDSYVYIYNPANQRTNVARADASTVAYKYDNIGQLTLADGSVNGEDHSYAYDSAWNMRSNGLTQLQVDNKNQLTNACSAFQPLYYDANGNLVTNNCRAYTATYDDENRLTMLSVDSTHSYRSTFLYDGLSRLRNRTEYSWNGAKWVVSSSVEYIYDGWRVIQERDGANNPLVSYTRGNDLSGSLEGAGGIGGLLARSSGYSSGNWTNHAYYFADGNGNITYMLDSSQTMAAKYRYDPFGNLFSATGPLAAANLYRFSSKEMHFDSELYYFGYRFYAPDLQRWINRDPLGDDTSIFEIVVAGVPVHQRVEGIGEPNLYEFVCNAPSDLIDDNGLMPRSSNPGGKPSRPPRSPSGGGSPWPRGPAGPSSNPGGEAGGPGTYNGRPAYFCPSFAATHSQAATDIAEGGAWLGIDGLGFLIAGTGGAYLGAGIGLIIGPIAVHSNMTIIY